MVVAIGQKVGHSVSLSRIDNGIGLTITRRYTGPRTKELLEEVPSEDFDTGPYGSFGA